MRASLHARPLSRARTLAIDPVSTPLHSLPLALHAALPIWEGGREGGGGGGGGGGGVEVGEKRGGEE